MRARKTNFQMLAIALLLGLMTNLGGCGAGESEGGEGGDDIEQQESEGEDEGEDDEEGEDDD